MTSPKVAIGVWLILVTATVLEVVTRLLPADLRLLVLGIIAISSIKAALIALYYQHLRYETRALGLLPLSGLVVMVILLLTAILAVGM